MAASILQKLGETIKSLDVSGVPEERKKVLEPLIEFLKERLDTNNPVRLNFICTHNSRRSHMAQIWAQALAHYHGCNDVTCYSGGTEATAMFQKVGETLSDQGFTIRKLSEGKNPVYTIKYSENEHPIIAFSKTYDDSFNPSNDFAAIMTCDSANEACPLVIGAVQRFAIMYEDPKRFDGTLQQDEKYRERSLQIATELHYVFSKVGK